MTVSLDNFEQIQAHDQHGQLLASTQSFADQIRQAWQTTTHLQFSPTAPIHHIVIAGLGGSAFGADVARTLFKDQLTIPVEISRDYTLPNHIGPHTLVILASFSGTTEESINCLKDIEAKKPQVMAIATGGDIIEYAQKNHYPHYQIDPTHNPAGQARTALGYSIMGTLGLLHLAGALPNLNDQHIEDVILTLLDLDKKCSPETLTEQNPAKMLALQIVDRRPIFVASDFLEGAVHVVANNFNENAKTMAEYKVVPEMNHHYLEGLSYPLSNNHDVIFIFVRSSFNHPRNQKRLDLNEKLVTDLDFATLRLDLESETPLTQTFELMTLGFYASYYLAFLLGLDPTPTPHVHWLKQNLGPMT